LPFRYTDSLLSPFDPFFAQAEKREREREKEREKRERGKREQLLIKIKIGEKTRHRCHSRYVFFFLLPSLLPFFFPHPHFCYYRYTLYQNQFGHPHLDIERKRETESELAKKNPRMMMTKKNIVEKRKSKKKYCVFLFSSNASRRH